MVLGAIISCSCFNIKGVEFTCMTTWLPYKSELMPAHYRKLTLHDMNIYRNINDDMKFSYIVTL